MDFSASTWTAVSTLLDEALDLEPSQRERWLDHLTEHQPQLAPLLRKLLAAHAENETADILGRLPTLGELAPEPVNPGGLAAGDRVGPYRLKRELGAGGMALVWLAERADGAFTRDVALKLPQLSRLRRDLAERFARERDILARLEHPHIARLYDAGVSADGLPYLALEYVEGQTITTYCDEHGLDVPARLQLFAQVLDAVQYAHANLVIHRDLKPSNVLVTAAGQVRLLDFGIAKLLAEDERAPQTQLTHLAGKALTPDYASPEQIKGEPLTIATDVYSLGVVLYELLTGGRPYRLRVSTAAQLELAILDADPERPSSAIETEAAAQARAATRNRLARTLAGDLDAIVLKALRKSPSQRYSTIAAFAEDLLSYREGRAVLAQPDSLSYRTRKTLARHKITATAAAAALLAILIGGATAIWQANAARVQAQRAAKEALHAQTVQRFLLDIFKANSDQQADPLAARATTARQLLDIGARRAAEDLRDAPEVQNEVLGTLADMYVQMKLDEPAVELRRQQVDALKRAYGVNDPRVAEALVSLATDIASTNSRGDLPKLLDEAERILDAAGDRDSPLRGKLLIERANYFRYLSLAQMRAYADQAAALFRSRHPENSNLLHALRLAALARLYAGEADQAERIYGELLETTRRLLPDAPAWQISPLVDLAQTQERLAKVEEAEANYRRAWELSKRINGEFNADALQTQSKLGGFLYATSRRVEGRRMLYDALHALGREKGNDAPNTVSSINQYLGFTMTTDGRFEEAKKFLDAETADLRQHYPQSPPLVRMLVAEADWSTAVGRYEQAQTLLDEADAMWKEISRGGSGGRANFAGFARARLLLAQARGEEALAVLDGIFLPSFGAAALLPTEEVTTRLLRARAQLERARFDLAGEEAGKALNAVQSAQVRRYYVAAEAEAELLVGQALRGKGDFATARTHLQRAVDLLQANEDPMSPQLARGEIELAQCYFDLHLRPQAQRLATLAHAIHAGHRELGEHFLRPWQDLQARLSGSG